MLNNKPLIETFILKSRKYKGDKMMENHIVRIKILVSKIPDLWLSKIIVNTPINKEIKRVYFNFSDSDNSLFLMYLLDLLQKSVTKNAVRPHEY